MMKHSEDKQPINHLTAHLFRENAGKMTAVLSRWYGIENLDCITDAIQDTFESAILKWRYSGVPDNPAAWLMRVARNTTINQLKRNRKTTSLTEIDNIKKTEPDVVFSDHEITDSQFCLLLACCRLELSVQKRIIITLHILCGFGTKEIANALLMSDDAIKKALYRAKADLKNKQQLFVNPGQQDIQTHITLLHTLLYLLFNEGYKVTNGKTGINTDLCYEAIRLLKMVREYDPTHTETNGLLALLFFTIARFPARMTTTGEWLTLAEQDRNLWNDKLIAEGFYYLNHARPEKELNAYYLEALIASLHCTAPNFDQTNWTQIVYLYRQLEVLQPDSVLLRLNRIVAEMHVEMNFELLEAIDRLETLLTNEDRFVFLTAKAYGYKKLDDTIMAANWYREALSYAKTEIDRTFILKKLASDQ
ncbi:RNA polymerase sigma factor [Flavobacterium cerinum]|uniref:Sigma-70 family RNA polymerase sigma factor n=1 Tax=Flavobacterium cerinum TaxID=2502784 RepID=A0ABY5ILX0_9FLAO|nr:sigma-70 family RNA polymerase sigma factor [Flavobacterium cerinum]UUC43838.1 sigma-70 family RNA polymerase sigma factor [Flavobacterium cerinum]